MWIFCCGMLRSGSTLQYQLTSKIVESKRVGKRLGFIPVIDRASLDSLLRSHSVNETDYLVVKCHQYTNEAAELIQNDEVKVIYVYRDIRDVVVSMMKKESKTFEEIVKSNFIKQDCLGSFHKWNSIKGILISEYKELTEDLKPEILKIAAYLEIDLDEQSVNEIADSYTFEQQKQRIQKFDYQQQGIQGDSSNVMYDPTSLLHHNHINSGKSGQWRDCLSQEEVFEIEKMTFEWLISRGYPLSSNLRDYLENLGVAEW